MLLFTGIALRLLKNTLDYLKSSPELLKLYSRRIGM
jgi:hypothetical protein